MRAINVNYSCYYIEHKKIHKFAFYSGMKKIVLLLIGVIIFTSTNAQWLYEAGVFIGGSNYSGDIGREMFIYPNRLAGSFIIKRNLNSRISLRATGSYLPLHDDDAFSSNEVRRFRNLRFTNRVIEAALGVEINYWDYDITRQYQGITPYLFLEAGAFYYHTVSGGTTNAYVYSERISYTLPFGIGIKSRIYKRLSASAEVRAQYTLVDDLDYNNPNIPSLRFGNPNTNDWYFFSGISLHYSFKRPPCAVEPRY